ncbi:ankyrin repeat-containing domain protein [Bombardia bombarda]|uniref:Ankyrin repeat-containing domain protein n=1 Tax=Bombardia bombarda TaxID=252184 RepID=A0AA39XBZ2_9PEZI|nr:ankyrin repeat-containing domain protein [Bombardia bombarda]
MSTKKKTTLTSLPNELLHKVALSLCSSSCTTTALSSLAALSLTSRRLFAIANYILYERAAIRHPYLLAWAAETNRVGTLRRLLAAGVDPDTAHRLPFRRQRASSSPSSSWTVEPWKARRDMDPCAIFNEHYRVQDGSGDMFGPSGVDSDEDKVDGGMWAFCRGEVQKGWSRMLNFAICKSESDSKGYGGDGYSSSLDRVYIGLPLHLAVANGHMGAVEALLAAGADINATSRAFCKCKWAEIGALKLAPDGYDYETTLDEGNATDLEGQWTVLHTALCTERDDAARLLMEKGRGRPKMQGMLLEDQMGYTDVLHHAVALGRWAVVEEILQLAEKADGRREDLVNAVDYLGLTPFWMACNNEDLDGMMLLARMGANVNADLGKGFTPLFHACLIRRFDLAIELVRLGADVNTIFADCDNELMEITLEMNVTIYGDLGNGRVVVEDCRPLDLCVSFAGDNRSGHDLSRATSNHLSDDERRTYQMLLLRTLLDAGAKLMYTPDDEYSREEGYVYDAVVQAAFEHRVDILAEMIGHSAFVDYFEKQGCQGILEASQDAPCSEHEAKGNEQAMMREDERLRQVEDCLREHGFLESV